MYDQIIEATVSLLRSPAFLTEYTAYEADFESSPSIGIIDSTGTRSTITFTHPQQVVPFAEVNIGEPPRNRGAPFPVAYVYHLTSDYPEKDQEYDIVAGIHQIGLTIFGSDVTSAEAESKTGRIMAAAKKLIERNQYMFGSLPRAVGASTVAFAKTVMPGMQLPKMVVPYHAIFVVQTKELRQV